MGIYLGQSPQHARTVALVLSLSTGLVLLQMMAQRRVSGDGEKAILMQQHMLPTYICILNSWLTEPVQVDNLILFSIVATDVVRSIQASVVRSTSENDPTLTERGGWPPHMGQVYLTANSFH